MTQIKSCKALLLSINQEIKTDSSPYQETNVVTEDGILLWFLETRHMEQTGTGGGTQNKY